MMFPDFYREIPPITLHDGLAELLGAAEQGRLDYHYADAVRLAGHSCPTVAGAWLLARRGLLTLFPECLPERGEIRVELRAALDASTAGVVGGVLGLITGAAGEGGFKGLGQRYARRNMLLYGVDMPAEVRLTRLDQSESVLLSYHPEIVPPDAALQALLPRVISGQAAAGEQADFARLWQARVRRILLEHAEDPDLIRIGTQGFAVLPAGNGRPSAGRA